MSKKIALVGHCGPDSSFLRLTISAAVKGATVLSADDETELHHLLADGVDLLLFNREMPFGFSETEGVKAIDRLHVANPSVKMMLISNYPEAQAAAVAAGALPGFGKAELRSPRVAALLKEAIGEPQA